MPVQNQSLKGGKKEQYIERQNTLYATAATGALEKTI